MTPINLNALVATHVFNLPVAWFGESAVVVTVPILDRISGGGEFSSSPIPDYAGSWARCEEVIEAMRRKGHDFNISLEAATGRWMASFDRERPSCNSEVAATAICAAALAVFEVEVPENRVALRGKKRP